MHPTIDRPPPAPATVEGAHLGPEADVTGVVVVLLIVLLVAKELASASDNPRAQHLTGVINVGRYP